jgi:hypothetical protein
MPTSYSDQFYLIDPFSPPPRGTSISFVRLDLTDQNNDGDLDRFDGDSIDGVDITASYAGDTVTIRVAGMGNVTYTGTTFYLADGRIIFTASDGQVLYNGTFRSSSWVSGQGGLDVGDLGPPCFTPGTMIETTEGSRLIETLKAGDLIKTRDNGPQPLLHIVRRVFPAVGNCAPVRIRKDALGKDADLVVSQQHRMLIGGWRAELYLGTDEALVAARHLVNGDSIHLMPGGEVEYIHLLFSRHEIVFAGGIPSESYHPLHAAELSDRDTRAEVISLFPHLAADSWNTARQVARRYEGKILTA